MFISIIVIMKSVLVSAVIIEVSIKSSQYFSKELEWQITDTVVPRGQ